MDVIGQGWLLEMKKLPRVVVVYTAEFFWLLGVSEKGNFYCVSAVVEFSGLCSLRVTSL